MLNVSVCRQVSNRSRRFSLTIEIVRNRKSDQRSNAILFEKVRVKLNHFHEVGNCAAGVTLDLGVSAHERVYNGRNTPVSNLFLVFFHAREAIKAAGIASLRARVGIRFNLY